MNISVCRSAYGRQQGSFHAHENFADQGKIPMTFIRAPSIAFAGDGVQILSAVDVQITAARQGRQLVTAFHPEVTENLTVHRYFLTMIKD